MSSRRSFLQLMGLYPIAAPLAAKAVADKAMGELAGVSAIQYGSPVAGSLSGAPMADVAPGDWKKKVLRFLAEKTIPDWLDDDLRERNRFVGYLDPDIASKKTWSMNVKIITQRERNIKKAKTEVFEGPKRGIRQRELEEKYGVWI